MARLDPRTVLFAFPCALTCVFLFSHTSVQDFLYILYLFTLLLLLNRGTHVLVWTIFLVIAHAPFHVFHAFSMQFLFLALSVRKICMVLSTGIIIFSCISVGDSIHLLKRMKAGKNLIIPVAICFRFIPTLICEAAIIRDALKARGLYSARHMLRHPLSTFELFLTAFLFRMFALGEELFFSLSTRGLRFDGDSFYREIGFTWRDAVFATTTALILLIALQAPLPEIAA